MIRNSPLDMEFDSEAGIKGIGPDENMDFIPGTLEADMPVAVDSVMALD